jgi:hypothetical protein
LIQLTTNYKPGGTLILAQDHITGRVIEKHSDALGCWTHLKMAGRDGKIIHFLTAHQVCSRPTHRHGITAFHQQESLLRQRPSNGQDLNPRRQFYKDLIKYLKPFKDCNEGIILAGDFNEVLDFGNSNMSKVCQEIELVDVMALRHPNIPDPATHHIRGTTRIDYFLVSSSILPAVRQCGYDPFHIRLNTDHRGMFLDLHTKTVFGNATQALATIPCRDIRSKESKTVVQYIDEKFAHLTNNNFFNSLESLLSNPDPQPDVAEKLDALLIQAAIHAGKSCRKRRQAWWSHKLTSARCKVHLLQQP